MGQTTLLKEEMNVLKKQKKDLQQQINTHENDTVDKFECLEDYEKQIKILQDGNNELEGQNGTLEMENADLVNTVSTQSDSIGLLEKEKMDLLQKITIVEQTMMEDRKNMEGRMKELEDDYNRRVSEYQQQQQNEHNDNENTIMKRYEEQIALYTQQKEALENQINQNEIQNQEKLHQME